MLFPNSQDALRDREGMSEAKGHSPASNQEELLGYLTTNTVLNETVTHGLQKHLPVLVSTLVMQE